MFQYLVVDECFPGGTRILTPGGWRMIEDIRPGDQVYSSKDGKVVVRTVTRLIVKRLANSLVRVTHGRGSFTCTPNHKISTHDLGYISAGNLKHGDMLSLAEGSDHEVESVRRGWRCHPGHANLPGVRDSIRGDEQAAEQDVLLSKLWKEEAGDAGDEAVPAMRGIIRVGSDQGPSVLLQAVLDDEPLGGSGGQDSVRVEHGHEVGDSDPSGFGAHEEDEPGRRVPGEVLRGQAGQAVLREFEGAMATSRRNRGPSRRLPGYVPWSIQ